MSKKSWMQKTEKYGISGESGVFPKYFLRYHGDFGSLFLVPRLDFGLLRRLFKTEMRKNEQKWHFQYPEIRKKSSLHRKWKKCDLLDILLPQTSVLSHGSMQRALYIMFDQLSNKSEPRRANSMFLVRIQVSSPLNCQFWPKMVFLEKSLFAEGIEAPKDQPARAIRFTQGNIVWSSYVNA